MNQIKSTRVSIVTGGASGIGRATVDVLLAAGESVVVVDFPSDALREVEKLPRVLAVGGDVTDAATNELAVALAEGEFGGLDAMILNAGLPASGDILTLPIEVFDRVLDVNVRGVLLGIRAAVPALRRRGGGRIVVTASTSGINADPNMWPYNTAKAAAINLAKGAHLNSLSMQSLSMWCVPGLPRPE